MSDPLIDDINLKINDEIKLITSSIVTGNVTSFDEYKKRTGVILGLRKALDLIFESSKNYLHDNDDE
jgi:hypothetical protein